MSINPFSDKRVQDPKKASTDMHGVFPNYREPALFDWAAVDGAILRAALQCATNAGRTIGIGPAMGGRGVVVTLYMGKAANPKRFAIDAGELHTLLLALIQGWGSPAEDMVELMRMTNVRYVELSTD